jgi:hypothetical protein
MSKNKTLVQKLCIPYCAYYKPGRNEELLCGGASVVKRWIQEGRQLAPEKLGGEPDHATIELIVEKMCTACDFQAHDCDFMEDRHTPACGGFVFLSKLVMSGQIVMSDIT